MPLKACQFNSFTKCCFGEVLIILSILLSGPIFSLCYFPFQLVVHNLSIKGCGMCCIVFGKVHIKDSLLLIGKSSLCVDSGFPLKNMSAWTCLTSNRWWYENQCTPETFLGVALSFEPWPSAMWHMQAHWLLASFSLENHFLSVMRGQEVRMGYRLWAWVPPCQTWTCWDAGWTPPSTQPTSARFPLMNILRSALPSTTSVWRR